MCFVLSRLNRNLITISFKRWKHSRAAGESLCFTLLSTGLWWFSIFQYVTAAYCSVKGYPFLAYVRMMNIKCILIMCFFNKYENFTVFSFIFFQILLIPLGSCKRMGSNPSKTLRKFQKVHCLKIFCHITLYFIRFLFSPFSLPFSEYPLLVQRGQACRELIISTTYSSYILQCVLR
jgi:hypothetical protein